MNINIIILIHVYPWSPLSYFLFPLLCSHHSPDPNDQVLNCQ